MDFQGVIKYADSKKQPYIALMDRLTNFLKQPDTILIICGYSFGDLHINERILTALKSNTSAHVYVLYYERLTKLNSIAISQMKVLTEDHRVLALEEKSRIVKEK